MPFTPAHPACVLPLRRLGLPMSALVVGSMAPDAPMFWGWVVPDVPWAVYAHTHSWLGLFTTNLVVGVVAWALWEFVLRAALFDGLPSWLRERSTPLAAPAPRGLGLLWAVPLGVLVGAATHVGLDEFSHRGRWAAAHVAWFRETHAGLVGTSWVQYGAGVLGLAVLAIVLVRGVWRATPRARPRTAPRLAALTWQAPLAVGLLTAAASMAAWASGTPLARLAYGAVTTGGALMVLAALAFAVVWQVRTRSGRPGHRGQGDVQRAQHAQQVAEPQ